MEIKKTQAQKCLRFLLQRSLPVRNSEIRPAPIADPLPRPFAIAAFLHRRVKQNISNLGHRLPINTKNKFLHKLRYFHSIPF